MISRSTWLFFGALLSAGAVTVHQLRYALAYGEGTRAALGESGHGYMTALEPMVGMVVVFAVAAAIHRLARGALRAGSADRRRFVALFACGLLIAYTCQELIEGELAAGHARGLAAVVGGGGWMAVPLAVVVGGVLAFAVRIVEAAAETLSLRGFSRIAIQRDTSTLLPRSPLLPRLSPLASRCGGRAPPTSRSF